MKKLQDSATPRGVALRAVVLMDNTAAREGLLVEHGLSVWLETGAGIVAILGCAHAGTIHTLQEIAHQARAERIHAVLGGLHLIRADDRRLRHTAEALLKLDVHTVFPGHCTGAHAVEFLREELPGKVLPCGAGTELRWP